MNYRKPLTFLVKVLCSIILLLVQGVVLVESARASVDPASLSETGSALQAGHFAEPLIATAPSNPAEDRALTQALAAYARRSQPDDVSDLIDYLTDHPHSVWASALQTNLGLHYLHDDYFSRAIEAWQKAWDEGKDATEPHARAMVDRAIGERARL